MTRHCWRRTTLGALGGALALAPLLGACGAPAPPPSPNQVYGPSYGRFSAAFPEVPKSEANDKSVLGHFPPGTLEASVYWVSVVADPLKINRRDLLPPDYQVGVGKMSSPEAALSFAAEMGRAGGATAVRLDGAVGYVSVNSVLALNGRDALDPGDTEVLMNLAKGSTFYYLSAVATTATAAKAFAISLHLR